MFIRQQFLINDFPGSVDDDTDARCWRWFWRWWWSSVVDKFQQLMMMMMIVVDTGGFQFLVTYIHIAHFTCFIFGCCLAMASLKRFQCTQQLPYDIYNIRTSIAGGEWTQMVCSPFGRSCNVGIFYLKFTAYSNCLLAWHSHLLG